MTPLSSYEFRENWSNERHTLLRGQNGTSPIFLRVSSYTDKINYKRYPRKFVKKLWVIFKPVE